MDKSPHKCKNCEDVVYLGQIHWSEHPGLCCDCYDLTWFPESLNSVNAERFTRGKKPIDKVPTKTYI